MYARATISDGRHEISQQALYCVFTSNSPEKVDQGSVNNQIEVMFVKIF